MRDKPFFYGMLLLVFSISCSDGEEQIPEMKTHKASFKLTSIFNPTFQNTFIEVKEDIHFSWNNREEEGDSVLITKSARLVFLVESEEDYYGSNCYSIQISLEKKEAKTNLVFDTYFRSWKYPSIHDERVLFYQNYDFAFVDLQQCYLWVSIVSRRSSDNFKINNIYKVMVNGEENWAIQATFKGSFTNERWLFIEDPTTYFEVTEGNFVGVLQ